jgi:hypothetical protein
MVLMIAFAALAILAAAAPKPAAGEVKLPLRDYLALVERIEAQDAAAAAARARAEAPVAELVAQRLILTFTDRGADLAATYDVEVRGTVTAPVALPFSGVASKATVEPVGTAAVIKDANGLSLVAPVAGHYHVQVSGAVNVVQKAGSESVALAPMIAAVSALEVSLPAGRAWSCAGAVVAEDALNEGRRLLRLALPRGQATTFETRRDVRSGEGPKALATAVTVTIIGLGRDGPRRHDIAFFEVARGEIGTMSVTLPAGVEPDKVVSDEGEATPWLEGRELRVERAKKLTGTGYLALVSQPVTSGAIPLAPVRVEPKVRARYLAVASDVAASFEPRPEASWARVDVTDLPISMHEAAAALGVVAAWRLRREDAPGQLAIDAMPASQLLDGIVRNRSSLTLLTVEGTLLHRERYTIEGNGSAFEVGLPQDATLWSAQVNDVPVRPLAREGRAVIPLGLAANRGASVEVVVVQPRAIATGRSTLRLALPEVTTPVLRHEWRLLLPQRNKYRYVRGDLARAREGSVVQLLPQGSAGSGSIRGRVLDATGAVVANARVSLLDTAYNSRTEATTDSRGSFSFARLRSTVYTIECSAPGFKHWIHSEHNYLRPGETRQYTITLEVGAMQETISVMSRNALPMMNFAPREPKIDQRAIEREQEVRDQVDQLKQGLVGGVRPIPVAIPETGKVLSLAGVLPPARVTVELEVKAPKK